MQTDLWASRAESVSNAIFAIGRDTLTYKSHEGIEFSQPVLGATGIECCDLCYATPKLDVPNDAHYVRVARTVNIFEFPSHSPIISEQNRFPTYEIPATLENLKRLARLPLLDEETYRRALDLINQWEFVIPFVCFKSIMMKSSLDVEPDGVHKYPVERTTTVMTRTRQPTQVELNAMMFGLPVDLTETVTVTDSVPVEEAMVFQDYCSSFRLYSQQLIACWALETAKRLALWMDMRTGKTAVASAVAKKLFAERRIEFLLIVCPVGNMYDPWRPWLEAEGFDTFVLDGTAEQDELAIMEACDVHPHRRTRPLAFIINYERVHTRYPLMTRHWNMSEVMIAVDETSAVKNPKSRRAMAMHELCADPTYICLLNGTPMEQGPADLWSQHKCLDTYGAVWGRSFHDFVYKWLEQYGQGKYKVRDDLRMTFELLVSSYSIRYVRPEADQFSGKDKTFRHVTMRPTEPMFVQTENIGNGFVETMNMHGETVIEDMTPAIIRTYGFWREVCCGYDKYREEDTGPYMRTRHEIDPKLLWFKCFLASNPSQPIVVYVEFNEQEQRLKEMLNELKIPWSSTRPEMRLVRADRLQAEVPLHVWAGIRGRFSEFTPAELPTDPVEAEKVHEANVAGEQRATMIRTVFVPPGTSKVQLPMFVRYDPLIVDYVISTYQRSYPYAVYTESYTTYKDLGPYGSQQRAEQVHRFNRGDSHVFILKWAQGRGISLSRQEAVKNDIGVYPVIISLAPPWSLGNWDQGQDRCVCVDPRTGVNVNTMIYSLAIKGTIEYKILKALRAKKTVQAELLHDIEVKGYENFVANMLSDMRDAMADGDEEFFDAEDMQARILFMIPPYSKLTEKLIINKIKASDLSDRIRRHTGKLTEESIRAFFAGLPRSTTELYSKDVELATAWDYLMSIVTDKEVQDAVQK